MIINLLLAILVAVLWGIALASQSDKKTNRNGKRLGYPKSTTLPRPKRTREVADLFPPK
jgi:hypothetical protein